MVFLRGINVGGHSSFRPKGKPACEFGAEVRSRNGRPDHERARRADVEGIEVFQLFGESREPQNGQCDDKVLMKRRALPLSYGPHFGATGIRTRNLVL